MTNLSKCLICGSVSQKTIRDTLRYGIKRKVLRCLNCGFIFLESAPDSDYYSGKRYRKIHGPDLNKESGSQEVFDAYFPLQEKIIGRIKNILLPDMKVLDVGCSIGHFLEALKGRVKERVGLELSKEHAEFIRENLDFRVYSGPIERVNIKEGPFDLVTSFQTLEHIEKPFDFLEGIAKNLKSNGYLYLELPNVEDVLLSGFEISGYEDFYYREPHVSYFSKDTLFKLLDKAGFEGKISTAQDYGLFNHLHWIFTNKPQDSFSLANSNPLLIKNKKNTELKKELDNFSKNVEDEYKNILVKRGLGESLTFLGKKKPNQKHD